MEKWVAPTWVATLTMVRWSFQPAEWCNRVATVLCSCLHHERTIRSRRHSAASWARSTCDMAMSTARVSQKKVDTQKSAFEQETPKDASDLPTTPIDDRRYSRCLCSSTVHVKLLLVKPCQVLWPDQLLQYLIQTIQFLGFSFRADVVAADCRHRIRLEAMIDLVTCLKCCISCLFENSLH